ncbi:M1 family metallopeptidase [Membranihabitans marinus]|uniref:M1 family metallopeptidase n=1 Tax=Membranihabitans marinus TaxID=1227546 RepID=UPI001F20D34B|nr:M1 family metallopeptidase [Membranihabitans marinus]
MNLKWTLLLACCFIMTHCKNGQEPKTLIPLSDMAIHTFEIKDPHSNANFNEVVVKHLDWKAEVDFDQKKIKARAEWTIENKTEATKLILDTKGLAIESVYLNGDQETTYTLLDGDKLFGQPLVIDIQNNTKTVTIQYQTSEHAAALQWLSPQQTHDKEAAFLFTQSQAILARTWLPCQDGPGVRFTYNAEVNVPKGMLALMSAVNPVKTNETGIYSFQMDQAIPSYLMALAVGRMEYQALDHHSGVYAEPGMLAKSAAEFVDLPSMINKAEEMYGPYRWGQYDVLVLPPSFPFGGMENPRLTFATPTIIAGDQSLVSLVAHELAHSWSGNLVTNSDWEEIWINEGFTVYFEHRIMEALKGREYSEMLASLTYQELIEELDAMKADGQWADTKLKVDLVGRDPDEGLTGVPYNKGYLLLRKIEETVGRDKWDGFLNTYFSTYAFHSMNTETLIGLLEEFLISENKAIADSLQLRQWIYEPGLPSNAPVPSTQRFLAIDELTKQWLDKGELTQVMKASSQWTTHEWLHFINNLPKDIGIDPLMQLDAAMALTQSTNAEIQAAWYQLCIVNQYEEIYPYVEEFLVEVGRRKFLTPLYKALMQSETGAVWAEKIYKQARPNYHPVSYQTIDQIVPWK